MKANEGCTVCMFGTTTRLCRTMSKNGGGKKKKKNTSFHPPLNMSLHLKTKTFARWTREKLVGSWTPVSWLSSPRMPRKESFVAPAGLRLLGQELHRLLQLGEEDHASGGVGWGGVGWGGVGGWVCVCMYVCCFLFFY